MNYSPNLRTHAVLVTYVGWGPRGGLVYVVRLGKRAQLMRRRNWHMINTDVGGGSHTLGEARRGAQHRQLTKSCHSTNVGNIVFYPRENRLRSFYEAVCLELGLELGGGLV